MCKAFVSFVSAKCPKLFCPKFAWKKIQSDEKSNAQNLLQVLQVMCRKLRERAVEVNDNHQLHEQLTTLAWTKIRTQSTGGIADVMLFQLSYQANWELVMLCVRYMLVHGEECK